jgi:UrcA family protein
VAQPITGEEIMMTRSATLAAAFCAAMAFTALPAAASDTQKGRASLNYSDLDLSSEAGRAELGKRFDQAAREMCGLSDGEAPRGSKRHCYTGTSASLKQRVASILSAHEAKGG